MEILLTIVESGVKLSITLWPRVTEVGSRVEPAGFVGYVMKAVQDQIGRPVSWTWNLNGRLIDEISKDDCIVIADWLRKRAKAALGGDLVRMEQGIDPNSLNDPESLNEFADFFERSGGVLVTE